MGDDFMELGETGLVPQKKGFFNKETGEYLDENGVVIGREEGSEEGKDRPDNVSD